MTSNLSVVLDGLAGATIAERKAAITQAGELLARGLYRDELVPRLQEVAQNDLISLVRDAAQTVLDAEAQRHAPTGRAGDETRHIFGLKCPQCQHITYFDKRQVCGSHGKVVRRITRGVRQLDVLLLKCEACGEDMEAEVDCEGYR